MKGLRVVTYNMHKGFNALNTRFVLSRMKEILRSLDCNVAFLQEVQGEHRGWRSKYKEYPTSSQFEFLADQVWHHYAYGKNAIYTGGHHGNALLSEHPFEVWENIKVSRGNQFSRSLLHGIIRGSSGQCVHLICAHLGITPWERRKHAEILWRRINEMVPANEPLILAGDFNDWNRSFEPVIQRNLHLREAFHELHGDFARTFPSWMPVLPLDRIYFRGLKLVDAEVPNLRAWSSLSDHLPLIAEFKI